MDSVFKKDSVDGPSRVHRSFDPHVAWLFKPASAALLGGSTEVMQLLLLQTLKWPRALSSNSPPTLTLALCSLPSFHQLPAVCQVKAACHFEPLIPRG